MDKVYIGKIVATHGIKGELRILSDFEFKDKVFGIGKKLIIDDSEYTIKSYRIHKNYDMVTLNDYKDINEVLFLLKKEVYFDKDKVFKINNKLIIDDNEYIIKSYRVHKNYDMVTLDDYNDINEVLFLLKKKVYYNKEDLSLNDNEILDEDLIKYKVITKDGKYGTIKEIFMASPENKILRLELDKEVLVPFNSPMIINIDKEKEEITIDIIDGM